MWAPETEAPAQSAVPLLGICGSTPLQTSTGTIKAQDLSLGDQIMSEHGGQVTLRDFTSTHFSRTDLLLNRKHAPIRFDHGSLSDDSQSEALLVAPDMPVHVDPTGEHTVRAEHLANGGVVRAVIPDDGVTYFSLRFSQPATLKIRGLRLCFGTTACSTASAQTALNFRQEERRVFRPMR